MNWLLTCPRLVAAARSSLYLFFPPILLVASELEATPRLELASGLRDAHSYCNLALLDHLWTLCDYNVRLTRQELYFRIEKRTNRQRAWLVGT